MRKRVLVFAITTLVALALAPGALAQDLTNSPRPSDVGSAKDKHPETTTPSTFGTAHVSRYMVPASSFLPFNSTSQAYASNTNGLGPRWVTAGSHDLVAPIHIPSGAMITRVELDFHDTSNTETIYGTLAVCTYHAVSCNFHPAAGSGPADCILAGFLCSGNAFNGGASLNAADLTPDNIQVDNFNNHYVVLAEPHNFDGTIQVDGMIVSYLLQVSPDPAFATFPDVPVGHPQHRFVEAIVATGITAGCGSGNYCPDSPVTRGQMAVFLSVALGLQFP